MNRNFNMNRNLYKILTIGLIVSLVLMLAGFVFGIFNNVSEKNIIDNAEENIELDQFISELINNKEFDPWLLSSVGILIMIAIPVVAVLFVSAYFLIKKNYKLFLISIGVLLVLALSAVAGFLA
jgi:uncharacterized membrane protein